MKRILVLAIAALVCLYALRAFAYRPYACERSVSALLIRTRLATEAANSYRARQMAQQNLAELRDRERPCCTHAMLFALEAGNEEILGKKEEALRDYRRALAVEPRPEWYVAAAEVLLDMGRPDEAVDSYATAVRFNPSLIDLIDSEEVRRRVRERVSG